MNKKILYLCVHLKTYTDVEPNIMHIEVVVILKNGLGLIGLFIQRS